jgi:hypothetical protein
MCAQPATALAAGRECGHRRRGLAVLLCSGAGVCLQVLAFVQAESIVYVQPTPAKVLQSAQGESARWPYDTNTYESTSSSR